MIFCVYSTETVAKMGFKCYAAGNYVCAFIVTLGLFSGMSTDAVLAGLLYFLSVTAMSGNVRFRGNPFSLMFCLFSFLFINFPLAFIFLSGDRYIFGNGLPNEVDQSAIKSILSQALLFLTIMTLSAMWGLSIFRPGSANINLHMNGKIGWIPVTLIVAVVCLLSYSQGFEYIDARSTGEAPAHQIWSHLFFDHACWILVGTYVLFRVNERKINSGHSSAGLWMAAFFSLFVSVHAYNGSKGAVLIIFIFLLIIPLSYLRRDPNSLTLFFSKRSFALMIALSVPLFYFITVKRVAIASNSNAEMAAIISGSMFLEGGGFFGLLEAVCYRFAMGGVDRFIMVFNSFIIDPPEFSYRLENLRYLHESTMNLILPGTPYPDSYAPTSQIFPIVIEHGDLRRLHSADSLMMAMNTQPYTCYGLIMIFFGLFSPLVIFIITFGLTFLYHRGKKPLLCIALLYFFWGFLSSYGIDAVIGNTILLMVSMLFIYMLARATGSLLLRS